MNTKIITKDLNVWFGNTHSLKSINISIFQNEILGIIGPANSGKTTFLRSLNRLIERNNNFKMQGSIWLNNKILSPHPIKGDGKSRKEGRSILLREELDVLSSSPDVIGEEFQHRYKDIYKEFNAETIRTIFGMVFALPFPLPISIFDNIAYGPRIHGLRDKRKINEIVEKSLKAAYLWDEVKDRLDELALKLSGGQQQRLCIARTLAVNPEVILFDEPCSGLDPISTANVEEAMVELKKEYTIILVTNNTKQAARVSDRTAFFLNGELVELDKTDKMFTAPSDERTEGYISGKFG